MVHFNPSCNGTTGFQPALLRKSVLSIRLMVTSTHIRVSTLGALSLGKALDFGCNFTD